MSYTKASSGHNNTVVQLRKINVCLQSCISLFPSHLFVKDLNSASHLMWCSCILQNPQFPTVRLSLPWQQPSNPSAPPHQSDQNPPGRSSHRTAPTVSGGLTHFLFHAGCIVFSDLRRIIFHLNFSVPLTACPGVLACPYWSLCPLQWWLWSL